jgi:hypothetical protein
MKIQLLTVLMAATLAAAVPGPVEGTLAAAQERLRSARNEPSPWERLREDLLKRHGLLPKRQDPASAPERVDVVLTPVDLRMARSIARRELSPADTLVLYLFKFQARTRVCPAFAVVDTLLGRLRDSELNKRAVRRFWQDYSTTTDADDNMSDPGDLARNFDWYILVKGTERLRRSNARLKGHVGSAEAWQRAMSSQQRSWERSRAAADEFILKRDAYRVALDAGAAVAAAERAAAGY